MLQPLLRIHFGSDVLIHFRLFIQRLDFLVVRLSPSNAIDELGFSIKFHHFDTGERLLGIFGLEKTQSVKLFGKLVSLQHMHRA